MEKGSSRSENVLLEVVIEWLLLSLWTTCFAGQTFFLGTSVQRVQAVPMQTEKSVKYAMHTSISLHQFFGFPLLKASETQKPFKTNGKLSLRWYKPPVKPSEDF